MATKKASAKKSTKKLSTKKSYAKKTSKKASKASASTAQAGKAAKGQEFDPTLQSIDAIAATVVELNEPRPSTERSPIPEEKFRELKEAAYKKKVAKGDATLARDKGTKVELAGGAMAAFAPAGGPVADAPMGATNFPGITATGWIPPDCTMATGPSHVVLSVNSSI